MVWVIKSVHWVRRHNPKERHGYSLDKHGNRHTHAHACSEHTHTHLHGDSPQSQYHQSQNHVVAHTQRIGGHAAGVSRAFFLSISLHLSHLYLCLALPLPLCRSWLQILFITVIHLFLTSAQCISSIHIFVVTVYTCSEMFAVTKKNSFRFYLHAWNIFNREIQV